MYTYMNQTLSFSNTLFLTQAYFKIWHTLG